MINNSPFPRFIASIGTMACVVACALAMAGCSDTATVEVASPPDTVAVNESNAVTAEQLAELAGDIFRLVGTPAAEHPRYCKALPFGAKPCGGPASYLVYSTQVTDSAELEPMVERYNVLSARYNEQEGLVSDCAVLNPVVPNVVNGICVASPLVSM